MHLLRTCGLLLCTALGLASSAAAQENCAQNPQALGTSRTVEIDTSTAPRFGVQYREQDFLADGEVVLTFDDGPLRAYTKPVLDALSANCTKATFFVVGRMAVADPDMVQEYARRGHTVGIHTWSHANLGSLTPLRARAEIELGFSAVQHALGQPVAPFFRFPYLRDTKSMAIHLHERQVATFSIDVDSKDYRTKDAGAVHRKVMADLSRVRKGIILFHDIQSSTARALPGLLADLKAKGYRVVHMVPKAQATTLAEFDAIAQQEFARKHATAAAQQPLAKRSLTWPAAGNGPPPQPIAIRTPAAAPSASPPPRPLPPGVREEDWRSGFWR